MNGASTENVIKTCVTHTVSLSPPHSLLSATYTERGQGHAPPQEQVFCVCSKRTEHIVQPIKLLPRHKNITNTFHGVLLV